MRDYLFPHRDRNLSPVICHKSKEWAYEEEYRVLSFNHIGAKPMTPGTVKEVYLGCRMKTGDKQVVLSAVTSTSKQPGIVAYQVSTDDRSYKLNFHKEP